MKKVVCLEKYSKSVAFWGNLVRKKKIPHLSVEEIIEKYKGFESENIDFLPTDKYESNLNDWLKRLTEIKSGGVMILGVCSEADSENSFDKRFSFAGYDFGTCEEVKTVYSSIFNEVLFGSVSELISFCDSLNENFLFPDVFMAKKYSHTHHELLNAGKDVEDDADMKIYEIWVVLNR